MTKVRQVARHPVLAVRVRPVRAAIAQAVRPVLVHPAVPQVALVANPGLGGSIRDQRKYTHRPEWKVPV